MALGGRPTASHHIVVPATVIDSANLINVRVKMRDIMVVSANIELTIAWMARHRLLGNAATCCNQLMGYVNREKLSDGKAWYCKACKSYRSIRKDSFFEESRIPLGKLLELMYWWSIDAKQQLIMDEVGIASEATVKWFNSFRHICAMFLMDHPVQIGGPGVEVEVDESKFMHRKYHRGQFREGTWVLGMVERRSNNCVMIPVPDRSAATLLPLIHAHVLPGTRIITDGWRAYNQLQNHAAVNHKLHFVDPHDPTVHTNTVEGCWGNCKSKYRSMLGTSRDLFDTYLRAYKNFCGGVFTLTMSS